MAYVEAPRSSWSDALEARGLKRLAGLGYGLAGAAIMAVFWPLFVIFLSSAPRFSAPWLQPSADVGPGAANPWLAASIDLALIAAFGLQHSLMARPTFKARWHRIVLPAFERVTYVHAANLVLLVLIFCWQPIPLELWRLQQPVLRVACWLLFGLGWSILLLGALSYGLSELIGLRQILDWYRQREPRPLQLKTTGLYRWLRHPMYVGVLLGVWATPRMTLGHALLALGLTVYVLIARRYEERDLSRAYGNAYRSWTEAEAAGHVARASAERSRCPLSSPAR